MNCTIVMKNMKTGRKKQIEIGAVTFSKASSGDFVAVFHGTPYSMGKTKEHYLIDADLRAIGGRSIVLRGRMNGIVYEWYITPR